MTVSTTTTKVRYAGDGSTVEFDYTFKIFKDTDMNVIWTDSLGLETTKVLNTHFTVEGAGEDDGGTVTFITDPDYTPPDGYTVTLYRELDLTQETDYVPLDAFPAEAHEEALDKLTMLIQQLDERDGRTITFPVSDPAGINQDLLGAEYRAGQYLVFDDDGGVTTTSNTSGVIISNYWGAVHSELTSGESFRTMGYSTLNRELFQQNDTDAYLTVLGVPSLNSLAVENSDNDWSAHQTPVTTNDYDLGSATKYWKSLYATVLNATTGNITTVAATTVGATTLNVDNIPSFSSDSAYIEYLHADTVRSDDIKSTALSAQTLNVETITSTGAISGVTTLGVTTVNAVTLNGTTLNVTTIPTFSGTSCTVTTVNGTTANFTTLNGTASQSTYADVAEIYTTPESLKYGTVVMVNTEEGCEVVPCTPMSRSIIGVISEKPGFLMNREGKGQAVGLIGKLPVRMIGKVKKGQAIEACDNGRAIATDGDSGFGYALESSDDVNEKLITCLIRR